MFYVFKRGVFFINYLSELEMVLCFPRNTTSFSVFLRNREFFRDVGDACCFSVMSVCFFSDVEQLELDSK